MTSTDKSLQWDWNAVMGGKTPETGIEALFKTAGLPLTPAAVALMFETNLSRVFDPSTTGLDHEGKRVPLYFGKGPGPHEFYVATVPEGAPRTPQRRNEYSLALRPDGNLVAHVERTHGTSVVGAEVLGEGKFSDTGAEVADVLQAVIRDLGRTFQPQDRTVQRGAAPGGEAGVKPPQP